MNWFLMFGPELEQAMHSKRSSAVRLQCLEVLTLIICAWATCLRQVSDLYSSHVDNESVVR